MNTVLPEVSSQKPEARNKAAKTFQDLIVWRKAHELVLLTYQITNRFPENEKFGLTSQFRRAAVSIPANIAEGFKKRGKFAL
jgi:hypothetical protein